MLALLVRFLVVAICLGRSWFARGWWILAGRGREGQWVDYCFVRWGFDLVSVGVKMVGFVAGGIGRGSVGILCRRARPFSCCDS